MRNLDPFHETLVAAKHFLKLFDGHGRVRAIGDHERRLAKVLEQSVKRRPDGALVRERRMALAQLAGPRLPQDLLTLQ